MAVTGRPGVLPKDFEGFPAGSDPADSEAQRPALAHLDRTREEREFRDGFGGWIARERATTTSEVARRWRPDAIVCDEADFGSMIAAESLGIPHATLLPRCSAVISHAGSGTVVGVLAHGLPMGADQPANADRCAELGVARVPDAVDTTPPAAAEALHAVLTDPPFRTAAASLRAEIAAMPTPEAVLPRLEALA